MEDLSLGKIQRQYLEWYPEAVLFPLLGWLVSPGCWNRMFCKREQSGWRKVERGVSFCTIRGPYALEFSASNHSRRIACLTFQVLLTCAYKDLIGIQALVLGYREANYPP